MYRYPRAGYATRLFFALAVGAIGQVAWALDGEIVDAQQVEQALNRGAILWDVREAPEYTKGHIPGAVNIGDIGKALRDESREDFLPTPVIEQVLGSAGIDPSREIIVYGTTGDPYAHFGLMAIRYFGGEQGRVYHGGLDDWKLLGRPVTAEPSKLPPVALSLRVKPGVTLDTPEVLTRVGKPGRLNMRFGLVAKSDRLRPLAAA